MHPASMYNNQHTHRLASVYSKNNIWVKLVINVIVLCSKRNAFYSLIHMWWKLGKWDYVLATALSIHVLKKWQKIFTTHTSSCENKFAHTKLLHNGMKSCVLYTLASISTHILCIYICPGWPFTSMAMDLYIVSWSCHIGRNQQTRCMAVYKHIKLWFTKHNLDSLLMKHTLQYIPETTGASNCDVLEFQLSTSCCIFSSCIITIYQMAMFI